MVISRDRLYVQPICRVQLVRYQLPLRYMERYKAAMNVETWTLDQALMDGTPGNKEVQLDLFHDYRYRTIVESYLAF